MSGNTPTPTTALHLVGSSAARTTNSELERTDTGFEATVTIEGSIDSLKTAATGTYKLGASLTVLGVSNLEITKSRLETKPGGIGVLTVTASSERKTDANGDEVAPSSDSGQGGGGGNDTPENNFHMEVDFSTITRPISQHSTFAAMDDADWEAIRRWQSLESNSAYSGRYSAFQTPTAAAAAKDGGPSVSDDNDWEDLADDYSEEAAKYAELVSKGVEEYMVVVPVVRKTSVGGSVSASRVGQRNDPPQFSNLAGAWLKTADRWTRDSKRGKWTHAEEWTGFESLDDTLYPPASGGGSGGSSGGSSSSSSSSTP